MTTTVKSYKDLLVWQKGIALVKEIYRLSRRLPEDERFGLTAQMRRASVSVPSNIAEGQSRHTTLEFVNFISHAERSLEELETQVIISVDLDFCSRDDASATLCLIDELQRMLNSLRVSLRSRPSPHATRH